MSKNCLQYSLLSVALVAGAAQAQCLTFGGDKHQVRTAYVDCLRTTYDRHPALVLFGFERAELADEARKALDALAQELLAIDARSVIVTAHADRIGDPDYNARLAARRAYMILANLAGKGVPEARLRFESKGSSEPVTAGLCDAMGPENKQNANLIACLQPDRRVEIEIAER